jgi:hypothetical protein
MWQLIKVYLRESKQMQASSTKASAKCQFYFFTTFHAFATFFVKSTKKHSPLLARVLFEFITKVTFQKYVKGTKSTSKSIFK